MAMSSSSMDLIHGTTRLDDRFLFLREIGHGISGVVLLALDTRSQTQVAIKVFAPALLVAGELEVALLRAVDARDPDHHVPIVSFIHAFEFRGSLCIAMELLGPAIFQRPRAEDDASAMSSILEQVRQRPDKCVARRHMELAALRTMVAQTCAALAVLHDMNIIHADLKPENILYRDASSRCDVKLIDFGNAIDNVSVQTMATDHGFDIQTILYRAPEVAMGVSISCAADMWSLGCIVLECVLGQPLFNATDRVALLVQMQQLSATPLTTILSRGLYTSAFERQATLPTLSLDAIADAYALDATDRHLRSFLASLLETSPTQRMTAKQALLHPFLGPLFPFAQVFSPPAAPPSMQRRTCVDSPLRASFPEHIEMPPTVCAQRVKRKVHGRLADALAMINTARSSKAAKKTTDHSIIIKVEDKEAP